MKMTMRKMLAILATLAMLCTVLPLGSLFSAAADESNLIANGDFAEGINGWFASGGTAIEAADGTLHGDYNEDWGFIGYNVNVKPNTDYTLTFDGKSINGGGVTAKMNKTDWSGTVVEFPCTFGAEWQSYTWDFNSGNYDAFMLFFQSGHPASDGQEIWLDNLVLVEKAAGGEPVTPDESENLVVNGDFETGDNTGWEMWQSTEIVADAAKDGAYGAHLVGAGNWGGLLNQTVAVEAGQQYKLSFWINVNNTGVNVQVKDGAGAALEGAGGWLDGNKKDYLVEWTFTATDAAVLINFCGSGAAPEDVYVDNVSLVAVGGSQPDVPADDALVKNGGFETGDLTDWNNLWGSCNVSFVEGYDSSYALKLECGQWQQVRQDGVAVEPDTDYVLTAWVKDAANFQLMVKKGDDSGNIASYTVPTSSEWAKYELAFNSGSETAVCVLLIGADAGCSALIDNVVLTKAGGEEPEEPEKPDEPDEPDEPVSSSLVNGGFENGSEGWELGSSASIYTDDAHKGSASLKIENPGMWAAAAVQNVAVKAETDYVIELWTKRVSGSNAFNLFMMDAADNRNLTVVEGQSWFKDKNTEWAKSSFVINTGAATEVVFKWSSESANSGVILVDDMVIYEKGADPVVTMNGAIANGDFETGDLTGWENLWGSCVVSVDESSRYTGDYGLNFSAPGQWQQVVQVASVKPNTDYTLIVWAANAKNVSFIVKDGDDKGDIASTAAEEGNEWKKYTVKFNSGEYDAVRVLLITNGENGGSALIDTVGLYEAGSEPADPAPDEPVLPPVSLSLTNFGIATNRPATLADNLILNGDFENAEGGLWQDLLGNTLSVVDDETAPSGNKSLYFNTAGVENNKLVFRVELIPNTDYVFSAWVKGAFISDDNRYNATIGVVDSKDQFLVYAPEEGYVFSNAERQIVPTCWDNEWHLRSVTFNSGRATEIGIAFAGSNSQMWIDDMALFTVDKGVKYTDARQSSSIGSLPAYAEEGGCADEDNLLPDANMDSDENVEFWSSAMGFENGFITFPENKYEYGTSMKYTESDTPGGVHAIKWIEVKPHTEYTFSVDIRVVKEGNGKLVLLNDKKRECEAFLMVEFDQYTYGVDWFNTTAHFNTNEFSRIGIAVVDAGGEALIDNMRLFERSKAIEGGVKDKYVEPPYSFGKPDSPDTGVPVIGAILAVALVPSSAAVAFKLRRKKEDEE